jgi:hypothetical protein
MVFLSFMPKNEKLAKKPKIAQKSKQNINSLSLSNYGGNGMKGVLEEQAIKTLVKIQSEIVDFDREYCKFIAGNDCNRECSNDCYTNCHGDCDGARYGNIK